MKQQISDAEIIQTIALLTYYGFDLKGYLATELVSQWLQVYPQDWLRLAVLEALYRGRYKAVSVEQILHFWVLRKQPQFHFTSDFETLVCSELHQEEIILPEELKEILAASSLETQEELLNPDSPFMPTIDVESVEIKESDLEISEEAFNPFDNLYAHLKPKPIQKFTPKPDFSEFYQKLKKFALYRLQPAESLVDQPEVNS